MPVKIVKKVSEAPIENQIKVGDCIICPVFDFKEERGVIKFLVSIKKKERVYRVVKCSEGMMFLESKLGVQFDSKVNNNISKNYMMVKCMGAQKEPSKAALDVVQRLVAKVVTEAVPDDVKPPEEPVEATKVKRFGGVKITRRN